MMRIVSLTALALAAPAAAQEEAEPLTPASVVAASQPEEWVEIAPDNLLVMELAPGSDGEPRAVVIQLMSAPFSQPWVENIRTLAHAHWWDGTSVYRVVDNWVAQWDGGDTDLGMDPGPMPEGVVSPHARYVSPNGSLTGPHSATYIVDSLDHSMTSDDYAPIAGFQDGWPVGGDALTSWPVHCYGSVGGARDIETTGTGSELYAVIGHAPRQLDRNIAVVGRVVDGIEHLSTLPRGTGEAGVYETRAEDTPILSVRLASELADPPAYEYLDTTSESFARYVEVRANRQDDFYTVPAGGVDVCNVQVPIREVED